MRCSLASNTLIAVAVGLLGTIAIAETPQSTSSGVSKVRIVRISQVKGAVKIDRQIGRGFEPAIANLPVVENSQLATGTGVAEVEFEDNSSLRLAPDSAVEFLHLEREASGATISEVRLLHGTAYISLMKPQSGKIPPNRFDVDFGSRRLNLDPATHVRLDLKGTTANLAVFGGAVHVANPSGEVTVPKKKTATFQMFDENEPTVAKDIESSPFDAWDRTSSSYHSNVAAFSAFNSPYSYGLNDMLYYGSFMQAGSCGNMWRPYFTSADWDPFANGTWAWYPGAGYSWVSPYPWAWTPYHSGAWSYCPNVGWGWMPGGSWYGINNVAAFSPTSGRSLIPGGGSVRIPHAPSHPPQGTQPAMIVVNDKPLSTSQIASSSSFVFRKDSAGMGVPRATLGRLDKVSRETVSRGAVSTRIYTSAPQTQQGNGMVASSSSMVTTVHRGYAPPPPEPAYQGSNPGWSRGGSSIPSAGAGSMRSSMPAPAPTASAPTSAPRR